MLHGTAALVAFAAIAARPTPSTPGPLHNNRLQVPTPRFVGTTSHFRHTPTPRFLPLQIDADRELALVGTLCICPCPSFSSCTILYDFQPVFTPTTDSDIQTSRTDRTQYFRLRCCRPPPSARIAWFRLFITRQTGKSPSQLLCASSCSHHHPSRLFAPPSVARNPAAKTAAARANAHRPALAVYTLQPGCKSCVYTYLPRPNRQPEPLASPSRSTLPRRFSQGTRTRRQPIAANRFSAAWVAMSTTN